MLMKLAAETAICGDDIDGLFLSWEAEIYDDRTGAERRETGLPEPSDDEESSFGEFLWEAPIYSPLGFLSSKHELGAGFLYLGLERILPEVRDLRESAWRKKAQVDPEQLYETWCPRRKVCAPIARIVREKPPVGLAESEDEADPKMLA